MKPSKEFDVVKQANSVAHEQFRHYRECMAAKVAEERSLLRQYAQEQLAKQMKPFHDIYGEETMPKETNKKLYLVDTIVTFRHRYVVEAKELEHAYDEVTMRDSGASNDHFEEVTQRCLSEQIIGGQKISKKEFKKLLKNLESDDKELSSYWMGDQLIRKIDYDR